MTSRDFLGKIKRAVFQHQTPRLKKRGEELFPLLEQPEHQPHHSRVRRLLEWLVIPPTIWLVDYIGLSKVLAQRINRKEPIDPRMLSLIDELEEPPGPEEQERAVDRERILLTGDYAGLLRNPEKYLAMEQRMVDNPQRIAHWNRIQELFKLGKFRHHAKGIIRRTQYLERSMPPEDFYLTEESDEERWLFRAIFDLYCKRYGLFGMRFDEALVERLTVTRTQFTTNISIPRYLKIARDDIMWDAVQETHWNPDLTWQGPKASGNELERLEMLRRIDCATIQGKAEGLKGEPLRRRVEELAGLPPHTDKRTHIRWQNEIKELKKKGVL
ncbi:MAG: hypothetical protein JWM68_4249 [Verrucomicrobiales bacterium]|nr:hypothetical protein [Verrucomicrobiales bacterium]